MRASASAGKGESGDAATATVRADLGDIVGYGPVKWLLLAAALLAAPVEARGPVIAITIDDVPVHGPLPPETTRSNVARGVIAALRGGHAGRVYGFVNAASAQDADTRAVLVLWRKAGLPLGNHTWSHADLDKVGTTAFVDEIARGEPLLADAMGTEDWHWLRFPFLHEGADPARRLAIRQEVARRHYRIAAVTMSFGDFLWTEPYARCAARHDDAAIAWLRQSYLVAATEAAAQSRSQARAVYRRDIPYVLLLHVGAFTARMLPELLAAYRHDGFGFVTLPQAEADPAYASDVDPSLPPVATLAARAGVANVAHDYAPALDAICR